MLLVYLRHRTEWWMLGLTFLCTQFVFRGVVFYVICLLTRRCNFQEWSKSFLQFFMTQFSFPFILCNVTSAWLTSILIRSSLQMSSSLSLESAVGKSYFDFRNVSMIKLNRLVVYCLGMSWNIKHKWRHSVEAKTRPRRLLKDSWQHVQPRETREGPG